MFPLLRCVYGSQARMAARSAAASQRWFSLSPAALDKIIYTECDEAPALATYSLLPVIQRFAKPMGIDVELRDISVAGRIIAHFPDYLTPEQQIPDELAALGELAKTPQGNIIKLPNVSASIPQLLEAIAELQGKGYNIPNFNNNPQTDEEKEVRARYAKVLGSAVNPVLREGNSDRRAAEPVKKYEMSKKTRSPKMHPWPATSRSCVSHMADGDFYSSEQSHIMPAAGSVKITLNQADGTSVVLKEKLDLQAGEVIDAVKMNTAKLCEFFEKELDDCKEKGLMVSLHMKATMMKVSDPIIFGHCVKIYYKDVFAKHAALFAELGVNANNGLGDVYDKIKGHPMQAEVEADLMAVYETRPGLAMVDSGKGITNLHVPSDVIIDASMPCVVRDGGKMWNKDDALEDVKCMIPDRCYARAYQAIIADCQAHGQFDWTTMGHVSNVGLMAQKAEEYGSHDKTFEVPTAGTIVVTDDAGNTIFSHDVEAGDIWRMCQTKDAPIKDWVKLAVTRAKASGAKAIFWLDPARAHDANIKSLCDKYLADHDLTGLEIGFAAPADAMTESCTRARAGLDTISCTGNVLRDYLTDLFPILELGTSAKMLSIVPLLAGGVLLETGAGGSAPKHVQQFVKEGHLRWDSLGEYLATAIGFQELGERTKKANSTMLGETLMEAVGKVLSGNKSPGRKVKQIDNRGTNFYIAMHWAEAMAARDPAWAGLAQGLAGAEEEIMTDLIECQGPPQDIGGYYKPDPVKAAAAMRPSKKFNDLIDNY
jgi:isocitrate dehydrogenase